MKNLVQVCIALIAIVALAGCGKDTPASPNGTNSSEYYPLTKGSTWTYTGRSNYTMTVLGDTTVNGTTWTRLSNSLTGLTTFARKSGTTYYNVDSLGGTERIMLKDEAVGSTWSFEVLGPNFTPNKQEFAIAETGITKTVGGHEYKDVMRVHLITYVFNSVTNDWSLATTSDLYFSKGVGPIYYDYGALGAISLASYSIK